MKMNLQWLLRVYLRSWVTDENGKSNSNELWPAILQLEVEQGVSCRLCFDSAWSTTILHELIRWVDELPCCKMCFKTWVSPFTRNLWPLYWMWKFQMDRKCEGISCLSPFAYHLQVFSCYLRRPWFFTFLFIAIYPSFPTCYSKS